MVVISFCNYFFCSLVLFVLVIPELLNFVHVAHFLVRRDNFFLLEFIVLSLVMLFVHLLSIKLVHFDFFFLSLSNWA